MIPLHVPCTACGCNGRVLNTTQCVDCGVTVNAGRRAPSPRIAARGMCSACYEKDKKLYGTTQRNARMEPEELLAEFDLVARSSGQRSLDSVTGWTKDTRVRAAKRLGMTPAYLDASLYRAIRMRDAA